MIYKVAARASISVKMVYNAVIGASMYILKVYTPISRINRSAERLYMYRDVSRISKTV